MRRRPGSDGGGQAETARRRGCSAKRVRAAVAQCYPVRPSLPTSLPGGVGAVRRSGAGRWLVQGAWRRG
jgi:hypothetical protein